MRRLTVSAAVIGVLAMAGTAGAAGSVGLIGVPGAAGITVRAIGFGGGAARSTTMLTGATRETFPDSLFAVPVGYRKRDFPGMR